MALDRQLVRERDLQTMSIFDALRGLHWTVVLFSGAVVRVGDLIRRSAELELFTGSVGTNRLQGLLIVGSPSAPDLASRKGLVIAIDAWRALHKKYDAACGALLLIRPDGYVVFHRTARDNDFNAMGLILTKLLSTPAYPSLDKISDQIVH